ncbi:MAG: DUF4307 domain-containing protein, partial [Mycobacteriaceae bacterium]
MTSTLPTGRYAAPKRRPRRRRNSTVAVLALGVIAGIVIAVVAYRNLAPGPISGEDLGFSLDGNSATVRFTVNRDDPSRPAVCIIR